MPPPSPSPIQGPRGATLLLWITYVLLVMSTAFGAFWVQRQFEEQRQLSCNLMVVQVELAKLEVLLFHPDQADGVVDPRVLALRNQIVDHVHQICPDAELP